MSNYEKFIIDIMYIYIILYRVGGDYMKNYPENPILDSPEMENAIFFKQTTDTLLDTDIYSRFIYNAQRQFYQSRFYKDYKSFVMSLGFDMDMQHPNITSEMADLDLHHNFPELKQVFIILSQYLLKTKGSCNTFELIQLAEEAHRKNQISVILLSKTYHQEYHSNPSSFISLKNCVGNGLEFIDKYWQYLTLDISFDLLLKLKQEEQYNGSYNPFQIKARDEILSWQAYNGINNNGILLPFNSQYYNQRYGYSDFIM